ncbi:bifunctional aspartate transaminase/aspartate 4-decarboxylase [Pseudodesulfovibrio senegalensis]|uniref:Aminotransferase n=1 Tax=Pseudodesulfovibrio senegalensis TaxID=1721087 RepID=A0A6N6N6E8_9BACT|nr:bifunctional aspartate transaminase/aspartate 4-decarboxylase [Pseudodesulfovibrio senegalensis]KAB1443318.1 bifunctional aspartate transaminase/aspartate 4-decarboxylase [Pseudodesulfovibrio senegalensis]
MSERTSPISRFMNRRAQETKDGELSRRDFLRMAAVFGLSISMAGNMLGLSPTEAEAAVDFDWDKLAEESPFEIKNLLIELAQKDCGAGCNYINAGRGNPNFLNTTARKGLSLFMLFAAEAAEKDSKQTDVGFRRSKAGLAAELDAFLKKHADEPGAAFLKKAMDHVETGLGMDQDTAVFQLVDAIQGDFYPDPPRILPVTEAAVNQYVSKIVFQNQKHAKYKLFATEGATGAMIYLFNSLKENFVLKENDTVAIVTPIFSPYLELPVLRDYGLKTVNLHYERGKPWAEDGPELQTLAKSEVKALYLVNPTNPTSMSLDKQTVMRIAKTVQTKNPNLVVISDTVYASFVDEFHTLCSYIPDNCLGVYSYSKYFGVTGWRLGVVMISENCIVNNIIARLSKTEKKQLAERYTATSTDPATLTFMQRLEMDSRQVALAHTGGLSCPQQVAMVLFSLFELADTENVYKGKIMGILKKRWDALFTGLKQKAPDGPDLTRYYALLNVQDLAEQYHGKDFAASLPKDHHYLEFTFDLARREHVVCLPGAGFAGPEWSARVALANIGEQDCTDIAAAMRSVLKYYYDEWKKKG